MIHTNESGAVTGLGISLVFSVVFLVAAIGFSGWAFTSRQDYKNNTDQKVAQAVTIAKQEEGSAKDKQFLEDEKQPLRTYNGPEATGSITMSYPKTWSGYIDTGSGSGQASLKGYFYPNIVPSTTDANAIFALRIEVLSQSYDQVTRNLSSQLQNKSQAIPSTITPYALPKLPKVVGVKIVGTLPNQKQGEMIILPLRSQTIQVWAETAQFTPDFETNILPNFSFQP